MPNIELVTAGSAASGSEPSSFEDTFRLSADSSDSGVDGVGRFFLLSKSEGFNFMNRLVAARDIAAEME